ncbi:hypothetical protein ACE01N_17240 [Saccharicrinis sp. FJH2]|uniref:gliding motility lipoprotein GldB n=1 Tax=Saccharicrinis sp. FJH65 TaxID=3344659 RepID=UPI0035F3D7C1
MKYPVFTFILVFTVFFGCKKSNRFTVKTDDIDINIQFIRFDQELGKEDTTATAAKVDTFQNKYPRFFNLYSSQIIKTGVPTGKNFEKYLNRYLTDTVYCQVYDTVEHKFSSTQKQDLIIRNGFKRYNYFFPERAIPDVYYMISGFNESVVVAKDILAISLEDYLGVNHPFYQWLSLYEYVRINMYPEKIPTDALWGWLKSDFPYRAEQQTLLNKMIYEGKIMFVLEQLLPDEPKNRILSYSEPQLKWCEANEKAMWSYIIEYKHLFSKEPLVINKYTDPAPFTQFFGNESSPRAGSFIGYRIVSAFMKNNKEVTLKQLLNINVGADILGKSGYKP